MAYNHRRVQGIYVKRMTRPALMLTVCIRVKLLLLMAMLAAGYRNAGCCSMLKCPSALISLLIHIIHAAVSFLKPYLHPQPKRLNHSY